MYVFIKYIILSDYGHLWASIYVLSSLFFNFVVGITHRNEHAFIFMSLSKLVLPQLGWCEMLNVLSFLTMNEIYSGISQCNRSSWLLFLREKLARKAKCSIERLGTLLPNLSRHDKVLLVSYPRCGNSFIRTLLESRFGVTTGSDSRPNRTLSASLLRCGFQGLLF